jgi:hypothetical protein
LVTEASERTRKIKRTRATQERGVDTGIPSESPAFLW